MRVRTCVGGDTNEGIQSARIKDASKECGLVRHKRRDLRLDFLHIFQVSALELEHVAQELVTLVVVRDAVDDGGHFSRTQWPASPAGRIRPPLAH